MATVIRLKKRQANKLAECAEKIYKASKKLMDYIEDELLDGEEFDERNGGGMGSGGSGGGGNFRDNGDDEDDEDDEIMDERRGVPGTGRYGRRRYRSYRR